MNAARYIGMWSGPRNISTAMMRAWGSRPDTVVCDEPLYAHYLKHTGYTYHPGFEEILANHETDSQRVIDWLTDTLPAGKSVFYQKHMAHHLLPNVPIEWTDSLTNVFLIRDPREMLLSLIKVIPNPTVEQTGLPQQCDLFERVKKNTGEIPPVIDAKDVLLDPASMLRRLCERISVSFDEKMLSWEPGIHPTDGVWARHWYSNTADSTGFSPYYPRTGDLPLEHQSLLQDCQQLYDSLACHKI